MAGVAVDKASAVTAARNLGRAGRTMPDAIANDPALRAAYYDGAGKPDPDAKPEPAKHTQDNPARKPKASETGKAAKASRPRKSNNRKVFTGKNATGLITHPVRTASGSGGGLLLAIFIYPLLVAVLKDGPSGASKWLGAKFLNKGSGTVAKSTGKAPKGFYNDGSGRGVPD